MRLAVGRRPQSTWISSAVAGRSEDVSQEHWSIRRVRPQTASARTSARSAGMDQLARTHATAGIAKEDSTDLRRVCPRDPRWAFSFDDYALVDTEKAPDPATTRTQRVPERHLRPGRADPGLELPR